MKNDVITNNNSSDLAYCERLIDLAAWSFATDLAFGTFSVVA